MPSLIVGYRPTQPRLDFTLSQYTKLISANAKGLVYEFALDVKGKVNGVFW